MAKAAAGKSGAKPKSAKSKSKPAAKPRPKGAKPKSAARKAGPSTSAKARTKARIAPKSDNAADALIGLVESPLVADLLAAAVTAAAATMLEHRLKSRRGQGGSLVKAVGAAAATAIGQHLADEFAEIRKAAGKPKGGTAK